jgi:uncharacterized protein YcbX
MEEKVTQLEATKLGDLAKIWTYPVKSLRRVEHEEVRIAEDGLVGDRRAAFYVVSADHARTGNTYRGKEDNRFHLLDDPDTARKAAAQRGVDVEVCAGERYFDSRPVSLVLDRWIAEVESGVGRALDPLRWRPNLYVRSALVISELELVGARISIEGSTVRLRVVKPIGRCVTTTYDQRTGESDPEILRFVAQRRDNTMGVYCEVEQPGDVRVGSALEIRG